MAGRDGRSVAPTVRLLILQPLRERIEPRPAGNFRGPSWTFEGSACAVRFLSALADLAPPAGFTITHRRPHRSVLRAVHELARLVWHRHRLVSRARVRLHRRSSSPPQSLSLHVRRTHRIVRVLQRKHEWPDIKIKVSVALSDAIEIADSRWIDAG